MIQSFREAKHYIIADINDGETISFKKFVKMWFFYDSVQLIVWYRFAQWLKQKKSIWYYPCWLLLNRQKKKHGIDIHVSTPIGPGLKIVHGGGVFLNAESIGCNCTFYQGVTLGTNGKDSGRPIIEDNVTIYTGAVISGNVIVNSGAIVGANAVVTKDIPKNTMVGGVPAKIIKEYI